MSEQDVQGEAATEESQGENPENQNDGPTVEGLHRQKEHFQKKAAKAEAEAETLREQLAEAQKATQTQTVTAPPKAPSQSVAAAADPALTERLASLEETQTMMKLVQKGIEPEVVQEAMAYAKGKGISVDDAMETPFIKNAISGLREAKRLEDGTPPPSTRTGSVTVGEKSVEQMNAAEHKANYQALRDAALKARQNKGSRSRV